eukprot:Tamp_08071.p1 GENE.Tamp_08071~~Tamp_08071.p1  ORF type:complete len:390 (-),score=36.60 Tamp_08071:1041-2210(-)
MGAGAAGMQALPAARRSGADPVDLDIGARPRRSLASRWPGTCTCALVCVATMTAGVEALPSLEAHSRHREIPGLSGLRPPISPLSRALRGGGEQNTPGDKSDNGNGSSEGAPARGRFGRRKKPQIIKIASSGSGQSLAGGCATTSRKAAAPIVSIYQDRRRRSIAWQPSPLSDLHDDINLVALFLLGFGAVAALALGRPQHVIHSLLTYTGFIYILLDSLWIFWQPRIVKSPGMVGAHHVATLLVLLDPLLQPNHRVYTSACLLVEINTLLLLLRRKLSYAYVVEAPFIATWVLLRNIWYPMLLFYFTLCFAPDTIVPLLPPSLLWLATFRKQLEAPIAERMMMPALLSWAFVCIFQFYWSYQLFSAHPWIWGRKKATTETNGKNKRYL